MKHTLFVIIFLFPLLAFGQTKNKINPEDIKGHWRYNEGTCFNGLIFGDKTVFVDNRVDTVFTLNYSLSNDTLITWADNPNEKYKNKIISITKDSLVLEGIREISKTIVYKKTTGTQGK